MNDHKDEALLRGTTLFRPHLAMRTSWTASPLSQAVTGKPGAAYTLSLRCASQGGLRKSSARPYTSRALSLPDKKPTIFPSSKNMRRFYHNSFFLSSTNPEPFLHKSTVYSAFWPKTRRNLDISHNPKSEFFSDQKESQQKK